MPGTLEKTATLQEITNTPKESMTLLRSMRMVHQSMMIIASVKEFQNLKHPLVTTSLRENLIIIFLKVNHILLPHQKFPNLNM
jgi:hypothetical protein